MTLHWEPAGHAGLLSFCIPLIFTNMNIDLKRDTNTNTTQTHKYTNTQIHKYKPNTGRPPGTLGSLFLSQCLALIFTNINIDLSKGTNTDTKIAIARLGTWAHSSSEVSVLQRSGCSLCDLGVLPEWSHRDHPDLWRTLGVISGWSRSDLWVVSEWFLSNFWVILEWSLGDLSVFWPSSDRTSSALKCCTGSVRSS